MKHKISLIIPVYNNQHQLQRLLSYYDSYKIDYFIIIADSSTKQNQLLNKKTTDAFKNLSLLYLSYPDTILPAYKLSDALTYANTPYSLICASDDFTTPSGIQKCAEYLEKNPDFTVAVGYLATFNIKAIEKGQEQIYWWERTPQFLSIFKNLSIKSEDPLSRLTYYFSKGHPADIFYGVYRTNFLKMFLAETTKYTLIDDYRFSDILPPLLAIIYGKVAFINIFYSAREVNSASSSYTKKTFKDFIADNTFHKRYALFKTCLTAHLCTVSQLSKEDGEKFIDKMIVRHLHRLCSKNLKYQIRRTIMHLPLYEKIKLLLLKLHVKGVNNMDSLTIKDGTPYYNELVKIRSILLNTTYENQIKN